MATRTPKVLADGQLASSKGTLYTVPALTKAYIKSIVCANTGGGTNTVTLYLKPGSTSRQVCKVALLTGEQLYFGESLALEDGDLIEGMATNATQVDFVIMGVEET